MQRNAIHSDICQNTGKHDTSFGKKDQPVQTKVIVTDIDGHLIGNVSIECKIVGMGRARKVDDRGVTIYEDVKDEQQTTVLSSDNDAVQIDFTPTLGKI